MLLFHRVQANSSPSTIALLEHEAIFLVHLALIGFVPTKHPLRIELQE